MLTGWLLTALVAVAPVQGVEVVMPTQAEQLASQLRLDGREQGPAIQEILNTANQQATPIVQEMMTLRQELLNISLQSGDMAEALTRYADAAGRMAAIEAQAFARIYEVLNDNQHSRAPEAFRILGGIFMPAANSAVGGGGGRGRGGN